MESVCDYCGKNRVVTSCEVCGSKVCREDKLDYGCRVCNGGKKSFE